MSRIKPARPALVVVVLTLIAAVAGTALAGSGPEANTSGLKKQVKKTKKKANKANKRSKQNAALLKELCGDGASASVAGSATCTAPQGPTGATGAAGATNVTVRLGPGSALVAAGGSIGDTASCNPGEVATGGGYFALGNATRSRFFNNGPQGTTEWKASVFNDSGAPMSVGVRAQVICSAP